MQEVDEFFEANYRSLKRYCASRWNGSGEDVLHSAYTIARKRYSNINFSLFSLIAKEAARNLRSREVPLENIHTPPGPPQSPPHEDPRMEKLMEILTNLGMDAEDVLRQPALVSRIRAEIQGQLSLFQEVRR